MSRIKETTAPSNFRSPFVDLGNNGVLSSHGQRLITLMWEATLKKGGNLDSADQQIEVINNSIATMNASLASINSSLEFITSKNTMQDARLKNIEQSVIDIAEALDLLSIAYAAHALDSNAHGSNGAIVGFNDLAAVGSVGLVEQTSAVADISVSPSGTDAGDITALANKVNEVLLAMRTSGQLDT